LAKLGLTRGGGGAATQRKKVKKCPWLTSEKLSEQQTINSRGPERGGRLTHRTGGGGLKKKKKKELPKEDRVGMPRGPPREESQEKSRNPSPIMNDGKGGEKKNPLNLVVGYLYRQGAGEK